MQHVGPLGPLPQTTEECQALIGYYRAVLAQIARRLPGNDVPVVGLREAAWAMRSDARTGLAGIWLGDGEFVRWAVPPDAIGGDG